MFHGLAAAALFAGGESPDTEHPVSRWELMSGKGTCRYNLEFQVSSKAQKLLRRRSNRVQEQSLLRSLSTRETGVFAYLLSAHGTRHETAGCSTHWPDPLALPRHDLGEQLT